MLPFYSLLPEELEAWLKGRGEASFRAGQIMNWVYQQRVVDWGAMTNLPASLRSALAEWATLAPLSEVSREESGDGETMKFLFALPDGKRVESVLIMSPDRRTVCVSSQVGCPARCAFCASGKKGLIRNLSAGEIVAQIFHIDHFLRQGEERVSHLVFMGMGEPLENFDAVLRSIQILNHPDLFNFSQRRITLSTVGVIPGIDRLTASNLKVNLALSLHAPSQALRQKLIPYAKKYPLKELLEAVDRYQLRAGRDVTYEYTLMAGINDAKEHADELAILLLRRQATVNIIPYNPVPGLRLKRPSGEAIEAFRAVLTRHGIVNTCRYTKGVDIAAACGQLALREEGSLPMAS